MSGNVNLLFSSLCFLPVVFLSLHRSSIGNSFRTMDGHGTQVYIHPSSTVRKRGRYYRTSRVSLLKIVFTAHFDRVSGNRGRLADKGKKRSME